jgi:K+-sensing histidine kinase KdpD
MSDDAQERQEDEIQASYVRTLSHQLKSPINSVQSLLNTIAEGLTGETNARTLYLIEKANTRIADAKDIIADLLDFQLENAIKYTPEKRVVIIGGVTAGRVLGAVRKRRQKVKGAYSADIGCSRAFRYRIGSPTKLIRKAPANVIFASIRYPEAAWGVMCKCSNPAKIETVCNTNLVFPEKFAGITRPCLAI